jgi:hypothetical protein
MAGLVPGLKRTHWRHNLYGKERQLLLSEQEPKALLAAMSGENNDNRHLRVFC